MTPHSHASSICEIRQTVRALRRALPSADRQLAEQAIYQQVKHHPKIDAAQNIAIFLSFDGELNTQPIIEYLWQQNKTVFLPVIHPFNRKHLLFLRYDNNTTLKTNKLGIIEPTLNVNAVMPYQMLDIIFTPLVAFDGRCYRIGMGGGYYDRLLANYQQHAIYPIGLAFQCQQIERVPNQPWDVQLPEIIHA